MLSVLHVIYDDPANPWVGGGGSVRVREIYRRLTHRLSVTVATGNYPGARDEVIDGISYVRRGARRPYSLSRLTFAARANLLLRSAKYDAAVLDFSGYTPVFLPTGRPTGVTVHHVTAPTARHRWGPVLTRGLHRLERAMIRRARRASATSASSRDVIAALAPGLPVDMVGAGVPEELFSIERRPGDFLLYFGRLDVYHKGLDTLLEALALLAARRPGIRLRIAGRGNADKLRALADTVGVAKHVDVLGSVSDAERNALFASAAVQLMPSRFEGFGLAAAEAMAAGVPIVASTAGSLPEVLDAPHGGVAVPPGDPAALAEATGRLLDDPSARDRLSHAARISARRFSWSAVAERHADFVERIAASHRET